MVKRGYCSFNHFNEYGSIECVSKQVQLYMCLSFVVGHEEEETGKLKFNKFEEKKKFQLESKK